jgi:hypothetical protein
MKNKLKMAIIGILSASFLMTSCIENISNPLKCGSDIDLGRVDMTAETESYFPFTGKEKIVLKNRNNEELTLEHFNPTTPVKTEIVNEAARPCDENLFDRQSIRYKTTRLDGLYEHKGKRQMHIYYDAFAIAYGQTLSELAILDYVYIGALVDSSKGASATQYYQFRGDTSKIGEFHRSYKSDMSFVADTTIGSKNFKNVISAKNTRHSVSFAKGKGLIAIKFDDELWMVDRIE